MKESIAASLVVVALIVGAGIGYFWNTSHPVETTEMVTQTSITTVTHTITAPTSATGSQESNEMVCVITEYQVWMVGIYPTSETSTTTQSYGVQTYYTATSAQQTIGYETTITTAYYSGTLTGAIAIWNSTVCTYLPFPLP